MALYWCQRRVCAKILDGLPGLFISGYNKRRQVGMKCDFNVICSSN